jgi:hypothetical protein
MVVVPELVDLAGTVQNVDNHVGAVVRTVERPPGQTELLKPSQVGLAVRGLVQPPEPAWLAMKLLALDGQHPAAVLDREAEVLEPNSEVAVFAADRVAEFI